MRKEVNLVLFVPDDPIPSGGKVTALIDITLTTCFSSMSIPHAVIVNAVFYLTYFPPHFLAHGSDTPVIILVSVRATPRNSEGHLQQVVSLHFFDM